MIVSGNMRNLPNPALTEQQFNELINIGFDYNIELNSLSWTCFLSKNSGVSFDIFKEEDGSLSLYYGEFSNMTDIEMQPPTTILAENIIKIVQPYLVRAYDYLAEIPIIIERGNNLTNEACLIG